MTKTRAEAATIEAIRLAADRWPEKTQQELADQFGVSQQYVSRCLRVRPTTDHPHYDAIAALLREHVAQHDIQARLQVKRWLVQKVASELKHEPNKVTETVRLTSKERQAQRLDTIRSMAEDGYTSQQIASAVRLHPATCRGVMARHDIGCPGDLATRHRRGMNATRLLDHIVEAASNLTNEERLIDFAQIDSTRLPGYVSALRRAERRLHGFINRLKAKARVTEYGDETETVTTRVESAPGADRPDGGAAGLHHATAVYSVEGQPDCERPGSEQTGFPGDQPSRG